MANVTMYIHHVTAAATDTTCHVGYAAVMVNEDAPDGKPKVVKGHLITNRPDDAASLELIAMFRALEKLKEPCDVTVVLKPETLAGVQPQAARSLKGRHYWARINRKASDAKHHLSFEMLDGQPHAGERMATASVAASEMADASRQEYEAMLAVAAKGGTE